MNAVIIEMLSWLNLKNKDDKSIHYMMINLFII
ncbi:hypothetical protein [Virgibacillus sp. Bac330]